MLCVPEAAAAYGTLFTWSFLAATVIPLGSEPVLFALILRGYPFLYVITVATLGNVLGACTTYWLAGRAAGYLERRGAVAGDDSRATRMLRRYGQPALLFSWVPLIGDALVAAAGVVRMPIVPFLLWTTIGKAGRYAIVAWSADAIR